MDKPKRNFFKKNAKALYFSHDSNARNDEKILQLRMKYGWEGYGIYWAMLESLRSAANYRLRKDFITGLAFDFRIELEKLNQILEYCLEIGLLKSNNTYYWSNGLSNRLKQVDEVRGKLQAAGLRGAEKKYNKTYSIPDNKLTSNPVEDRFNEINLAEN